LGGGTVAELHRDLVHHEILALPPLDQASSKYALS
jgi:hypothetical protein